jgi:hypothetical protein
MESESDMIEMTNPECRAPSRFLGVDGSTERDVAIRVCFRESVSRDLILLTTRPSQVLVKNTIEVIPGLSHSLVLGPSVGTLY